MDRRFTVDNVRRASMVAAEREPGEGADGNWPLVVGSHRRPYELFPAIFLWLAIGFFAGLSGLVFWDRTSEGFDAWAAIFSPALLWLFFGPSVYVELFKRADRLVITPEAIDVSMRAGSSFRAKWRDLREVRERERAFRHTFILVFADGKTVVFGTHRGDDEAEPLHQALHGLAPRTEWSTPRWWDRLLYF